MMKKRILIGLSLLTPVAALVFILFGLDRDGRQAQFVGMAMAITFFAHQLKDFLYLSSIDRVRKLERRAEPMRDALSEQSGSKVLPVVVDEAIEQEEREFCGPPSAACYSIYPNRVILIEGEMFEVLSDDEVAAIMAHEHAHFVLKHNWMRFAVQFALASAAVACAFLFASGSPAGALSMLTICLALILLPLKVYRRQEFQADELAASWVGADTLCSALTKIDDPKVSSKPEFLRTHPILARRLEHLQISGAGTSGTIVGSL